METKTQTFIGHNILTVIAGTTGYTGQRDETATYIEIENCNGSGLLHFEANNDRVIIRANGDSELNTLLQGLSAVVEILRSQLTT